MRILITGGAGFIGSHFVELLAENECEIAIFDLMTYASNIKNIEEICCEKYLKHNIANKADVKNAYEDFNPDVVVNFAAETNQPPWQQGKKGRIMKLERKCKNCVFSKIRKNLYGIYCTKGQDIPNCEFKHFFLTWPTWLQEDAIILLERGEKIPGLTI